MMIRTLVVFTAVALATTALAQVPKKKKPKPKIKVLLVEVRDLQKVPAAKIAKATKALRKIAGVSNVVADKRRSAFKVTHKDTVDPWTIRGKITEAGIALALPGDDDEPAAPGGGEDDYDADFADPADDFP